MQKLFKRASIVYFAYLLLMIILSIAFLCFGYRFVVSNEIIWFVINIAVVGILTALCLSKRKESVKSANIIAQLLPLFAIIYIIVIIGLVDGVDNIIFSLHGLLCFLSCYVISMLYTNKRVFRIVCTVLNSIILLFLLYGILIFMTIGNLGQNTIVRQETSPDESYTAVLIASDQGALGGDTLVNIEYNTPKIITVYGRFEKRLYTGDWGEFETMSLEWKDTHTLLINGKAYSID